MLHVAMPRPPMPTQPTCLAANAAAPQPLAPLHAPHGTPLLLLQAKRKRDNVGDVKIVVAGCVAQQEGQQLLRRVPELDVVMGPQFANKINQLLEQVEQGSQVGGHTAAWRTHV